MLKHENQEDQNQSFVIEYSKAEVRTNLESAAPKNSYSDSELKSGLESIKTFQRNSIAIAFSCLIFLFGVLFLSILANVYILFFALALIFFGPVMFCLTSCSPIFPMNRKAYINHPILFEITSLGKVLETGRPDYIEPILSMALPKITSENAYLLTPFQRTKLSYCLSTVREKTYLPNLKSTKSFYLSLGFKLVKAMEILNDPIFIPDLLFWAKRKSSKNPEVRKLAEFAQTTAQKLTKVKRVEIQTAISESQIPVASVQTSNPMALESEKKILRHFLEDVHSGKRRVVALGLAGLGCLISALTSVQLSRIDGELVGNPLPSIGVFCGAIAITTVLYFKIGEKLIRRRSVPQLVSLEDEELTIGVLQNPIHLSNLLAMIDKSLSILGEKQTDEVYRSITHILNSCSEKQPFTLSRKDKRILKERISLYYGTDILDSDRNHQFLLSIFHALPIIGDESFMKQVWRYSEFEVRESNPQIAELKAAAQECLPKLEALVERQKSSGTLLRASSINETGGETLLRATSGQEDSQPETLLRASVIPTESTDE